MNILFLSLGKYKTIYQPGIYTDLLREFTRRGHKVYVLSSIEARDNEKEEIICEKNCQIIRVYTGDIQKTSLIKKGINTLLIQSRYTRSIKQYLSNVRFDLILYPTPPITFVKVVEYVKRRDGARTYLMLKDIFPQNAVDIGMMTTNGLKGLIYKYFRRQETQLYKISDRIGCMSQANVNYILKNNREVNCNIVEVCPNSIEVIDKSIDENTRLKIRLKYGIPEAKRVFVYGGNLGKPQGVPFLIKCLLACADIETIYFLIVGEGTEYHLIEEYANASRQENLKVMKRLPKEDYDILVAACDVGMIFLDHRFTIPNFPSRLLSYMQAKLPVIAVTDPNTDIGKVITDAKFGWWCESNSTTSFKVLVRTIVKQLNLTGCSHYKNNAFEYLKNNYSVSVTADTVLKDK